MKRWIACLLAALLLAGVLGGCTGMPAFPAAGPPRIAAGEGTADSAAVPAAGEPADLGTEAPFSILFLDVGQADAMLVSCSGAHMLVDGGTSADSDVVSSVLRSRGIEVLDYVVCTHAHEDHAGGLAGALNTSKAEVILAPVTEAEQAGFSAFAACADRQGVPITVPEPDQTFRLGEAQVQVLGPRRAYEETNNTSLVLMVTYGETRFLLTGDMESRAEQDLVEAGCALQADLLKIGHHGSDTSTSYRFLNEVMPDYAVIQAGRDNDYGHPREEVLSRLRDAGAALYRTDLQGDILAESDGRAVTVTPARNAGIQTNPTELAEGQTYYIGNLRTRKFHRPDCGSLPAERNRVWFYHRSGAVEAGYAPCGQCRP